MEDEAMPKVLKYLGIVAFIAICTFTVGFISAYLFFPKIIVQEKEVIKTVNNTIVVESPPKTITLYKEVLSPPQARHIYAWEQVVPGETFRQCAYRLWLDSRTDAEFVDQVRNYIIKNIRYENKNSWGVLSPERVWVERKGDCSEMSLLATEMLKSQGYDATYIYGITPEITSGNNQHARTRVTINIDTSGFRKFELQGTGLAPGEYIVD